MRRRTALGLLAIAVPASFATIALAKRMIGSFDAGAPVFEMTGRPVGGARVANATAAYLTGSRIMAVDDGALVIDADSGALIKTDKTGKSLAQLAIGIDAGLLTYDPIAKLAYVANRQGDKITVVRVGDKLEVAQSWKTPAEPYGVALSPDRKTLFVSTIADRTFVAYEAATGKERWRSTLAREPRGVAVAPDGTRALVGYLATGTVDQIDLVETHRPEHIALSTAGNARRFRGRGNENADSFARAAFAVTFMGDHQAVTAFQRETPIQIAGGGERTGSYGGGFESPVTHQLAFLGMGGSYTTQTTAQIAQHQPRALAWDQSHDALYVAGLGTDTILQIKNASQVGIAQGITASVASGKSTCGPDGLAVMADGNLLVWCSFTRNVQRVDFIDAKGALAAAAKVSPGPTVIASSMTDKRHEGMVLFHAAAPQISQRGGLACSTCHPDSRTDGLSWRIDKHELQTPLLNGRVVGTHPYKWDGGDPDLKASLTSTMKRLGGFGITKEQTDSLAAFVEGIPAVRTPTREVAAVTRGKKMFDEQLGCRSCHDGTMYTDNERHKLTGTLVESDTPSLIGLAASAPYYHDGSAATLEALLRDRGAVHGMAETTKLNDQQVADLTAFLESL
ncbi:MAG: PQQ-binding-like beta-propeller repeat protein [Deltaproteobacteria bacterium]|nr:PQQ-binding-like beta-propeller repeat protein [Deltaproteobacteria bacterium]